MTELWGWVDGRTGRRVSITSAPTREQAEAQLAAWLERDRRGGRPDLRDVMPYVIVVRLNDA